MKLGNWFTQRASGLAARNGSCGRTFSFSDQTEINSLSLNEVLWVEGIKYAIISLVFSFDRLHPCRARVYAKDRLKYAKAHEHIKQSTTSSSAYTQIEL
jgi:hypothetical protein